MECYPGVVVVAGGVVVAAPLRRGAGEGGEDARLLGRLGLLGRLVRVHLAMVVAVAAG